MQAPKNFVYCRYGQVERHKEHSSTAPQMGVVSCCRSSFGSRAFDHFWSAKRKHYGRKSVPKPHVSLLLKHSIPAEVSHG
jgi:hypothetical protein